VQFWVGGMPVGNAVTLVNASASYSTSFASSGPVTVYAVYNGDTNNPAATSANLAQTVVATTTIGVYDQANPTPVGSPVTFSGTISSNEPWGSSYPTGSIQFFDNGTLMGTVALPANAYSVNYTAPALTQGTHAITAYYSGDTYHTTSTSPALQHTLKLPITFTFVSSANPATAGQAITYTGTVTPSAATCTASVLRNAVRPARAVDERIRPGDA